MFVRKCGQTGIPAREGAKTLRRIADLRDEHAAELGEPESLNTAEFFRCYAGWCTNVSGSAQEVQAWEVLDRRPRLRPRRRHAGPVRSHPGYGTLVESRCTELHEY